jgi:hypothetical protein
MTAITFSACLYNATEAVSDSSEFIGRVLPMARKSDITPQSQIAKIDMFAGFAEICQGELWI